MGFYRDLLHTSEKIIELVGKKTREKIVCNNEKKICMFIGKFIAMLHEK
jgi:hypothetical protein